MPIDLSSRRDTYLEIWGLTTSFKNLWGRLESAVRGKAGCELDTIQKTLSKEFPDSFTRALTQWDF